MTQRTAFAPTSMLGIAPTQAGALVADQQQTAASISSPQPTATLVIPENFPVPLSQDQLALLADRIERFSFMHLATRDIPSIGLSAEQQLGTALDAFLSRIEQRGNPSLFKLTDELTNQFESAKLEEVADRILNAEPSAFERFIGLFSKRYLRTAMANALEDVSRLASGRSKTLSDHVNSIQKKLELEMVKLGQELAHGDQVKEAYRSNLVSFAVETAFLHNALLKARAELAAAQPVLAKDPQALQDALDKIQALESRALAVEGGLTKLPSDQIVIRQLQNAGIATLQELSTTMASRFNSIKSELLVIHGALSVERAQQLAQQGAALDANLGKVREKLMGNVTATAATMPGQNRVSQAQQIKAAVASARSLQKISDDGRTANQKSFEEARQTMAMVRKDLLEIGIVVRPGTSVAGQY